jgi:hypothetical protein
MKMNNLKTIIIFLILVLIISCSRNKNKYSFANQKEKIFYTKYSGFDYIRFPLIYPYEAINGERGSDKWLIDLCFDFDYESYNSIYKVKGVCVVDSIILAYSTDSIPIIEGREPLQWFVIVPSDSIEMGFSSEVELKSYIKQYGITQYEWKDVDDTHKEFRKTGCLSWIAGCNGSVPSGARAKR